MRAIDADSLLSEMKCSGKAAYMLVQEAPDIDPESLRPRWIPVSERLPEIYEDVLITYQIQSEEEARIWIGYLSKAGWCAYGVYKPDITAWMPLPEPYDPEDVEQEDKL